MKKINDYPSIREHIISPKEAFEKGLDKSLLVMVDHSKVSLSMAPDLCAKLDDQMVIIDHHRRGEEFPEKALLVYNEPSASSTCELITEMFEYQPQDSESLNYLEATAMLMGIRVDTKSFVQNATSRTYDAASYLRSAGADGVLIQKLMEESPQNFLACNHLVAGVTFIKDRLAICVGEEDQLYGSVIAAQAADMLLRISKIDASFVVVRLSHNLVGVSARSMGNFNVQLVMEKMGGGGHLANAATQVSNQPVSAVKERLVEILKDDRISVTDREE